MQQSVTTKSRILCTPAVLVYFPSVMLWHDVLDWEYVDYLSLLGNLRGFSQVCVDATETEQSLEWDSTDIQIKVSPTASIAEGKRTDGGNYAEAEVDE